MINTYYCQIKKMKTKKIIFISIVIVALGLLIYAVSRTRSNTTDSTISRNETKQWILPTESSPYIKPSEDALRKILPPLAYNITQQNATEIPYSNEYVKKYEAGIYVDIVSGEPLFSSSDKYDSGTGWPSFVKPITPDAITSKIDKELGIERIEVRSKYADSHLGHIFDDGPADRGGKRYCINGFALRFVAKDQMVASGYGEYLKYVSK